MASKDDGFDEFIDSLDGPQMMGFILAMLGGLDDTRPDVHWHYCTNPQCRHAWQHDRAEILRKKLDYQQEHTCPQCRKTVCINKCKTEGEARERGLREAAAA